MVELSLVAVWNTALQVHKLRAVSASLLKTLQHHCKHQAEAHAQQNGHQQRGLLSYKLPLLIRPQAALVVCPDTQLAAETLWSVFCCHAPEYPVTRCVKHKL